MKFVRPNVRAFPRLECGKLATLIIGGERHEGQVIDISQGGCKALPFHLDRIIDIDPDVGADFVVDLLGQRLTGRLAWMTPNYSAMGCVFERLLTPAELELFSQSLPTYALAAE